MTVLKKYNSVSGLWQPVQVGVPGENSTVPGPTGPTGPTGPQPTLVAATTSVSGIVELATAAETLTGTDSVRAVTPIGLEPLRSRLTATVADFTALAALSTTNKLAGDLAFVVEGEVYMSWSGALWRQNTRATFATTAARDTAYAKASGAYLVSGVEAVDASSGVPFKRGVSAWLFAGDQPFCVLGKSADQNLSTTSTPLTWNVQLKNDFAMHSTTVNNSRIVAPVAGTYLVVVSIYNSNASGRGVTVARLNGLTDIQGSADRMSGTTSVGIPLRFSFPAVLAVNDYVEIMVYHENATGAIAGASGPFGATLSVSRIGA